jgi:hypothetical protein
MGRSSQERRRTSRADLKVPIRLGSGGQDALSVSTLNIGAGGVYVEVPRFIEPLTKLQLAMHVPGPTAEEEPTFLETEAIVVRTIPEKEEPGRQSYEIACAFLTLADEHRDAINRYVLTHGTQPQP